MLKFPTNGWANVLSEEDAPGTLHKINVKKDGVVGVWYKVPSGYMAINTFPDGRPPQVTVGRTMTEVRRRAESMRKDG